MGLRQLEQVILRSMEDEAFLDLLIISPEKALNNYRLTGEEQEVLAAGDEIRLNLLLGFGGSAAAISSNQYHHSQHKGGMTSQKPDLLPRVVLS